MPTIDTLTAPLRRETDRGRIVGRLQDVQQARFDLIAPQSALSAGAKRVAIDLSEPVLTDSGVIPAGPLFAGWTRTAWRNLAERLRIPGSYLDRLVADGFGALAGTNITRLAAADARKALFRLLACDDGMVLAAVLSDRYFAIDNVDVLTAVATGMAQADQSLADAEVDADWTNDRFRMRITVPQVGLAAADLLADYRWPFSYRPERGIHDPADGSMPPVMWAGIEVANSETGGGALTVVPRIVVQICRNGMTRPMDLVRNVHLGARLEQGAVTWSTETYKNALNLVTSQVADCTRQFVSVEYLSKVADEMRAAKGVQVESPSAAVQVVQQRLGFSDDETKSVMDAFMRGGDTTVLGLGQAVTAAAQTVDDGDRQSEIEGMFWQIVQAPQVFAGAGA